MGSRLEVAQRGSCLTVSWRVEDDGESQPRDFFQGLSHSDQNKAASLFRMLAERCFIQNTEKFKKLNYGKKDLWELKPTNQIRFLGDFCRINDETYFVIVLGLRKKQGKHKPKDLQKAIGLLEDIPCN